MYPTIIKGVLALSSLNHKKNILIIGFYDRNNFGDDFIRNGLLQFFLKRKFAFQFVSFPRNRELLKFILKVRNSKKIILGGGTHFIRSQSKSNFLLIFKYLILFLTIRLFNKELYFLSIGLEKPKNVFEKIILQFIFSLPKRIYLRDNESADVLKEITNKEVTFLSDLGLLNYNLISLGNSKGATQLKPTIGLNLINFIDFKNIDESIKKTNLMHLNNILNNLANNFSITFFSFYSDESKLYDHKILDYFDDSIRAKIRIVKYNSSSFSQFINEFNECAFLIVTRYHAIELSLLLKMNFFPLVYQDKCQNLLKQFGFSQDDFLDIRKIIDIDKIYENINIIRTCPKTININSLVQSTFKTLDDILQ